MQSRAEPTIDTPDGLVHLASGRPGRLTVLDHHRWHRDRLIPESLLMLLAQQVARSGAMIVHGAAIRIGDQGMLVLGGRGSGKSILSAAALAAGCQVVSDDWLLLGHDSAGRLVAERLRDFLMWRRGWATDQLLHVLCESGFELQERRKRVLFIAEQSVARLNQLPEAVEIRRLCLLKRPRGARTTRSSIFELTQGQAMAALIEATVPALFTKQFAAERAALLNTSLSLLTLGPFALCSGVDLVTDPSKALARLME
ncbi:MAG: hypothetical protein Kow0020_00220 [Wenzhouxiangellaceae bacterium]